MTVDELREAAVLCGAGGEWFAAERLRGAADIIDDLKQRLDYWIDATAAATERAIEAEHLIRSVQAELLAGGSLARLRAIVNLSDKETRTDA